LGAGEVFGIFILAYFGVRFFLEAFFIKRNIAIAIVYFPF
jgi:hypothetical protein